MSARLSFADFLESAPGKQLLAWENEAVSRIVEDVFGHTALQVGCPKFNALAANRMQSKWLVTDDESAAANNEQDDRRRILADADALPIAAESIDLVILAHALDFSASPQLVLREAARVLEPEGRLVLTALIRSVFGGCANASFPSAHAPICRHEPCPFRSFDCETGLRSSGSKSTSGVLAFIRRDCVWKSAFADGHGSTKRATDGRPNFRTFTSYRPSSVDRAHASSIFRVLKSTNNCRRVPFLRHHLPLFPKTESFAQIER